MYIVSVRVVFFEWECETQRVRKSNRWKGVSERTSITKINCVIIVDIQQLLFQLTVMLT